jgi:hypothetical protein
MSIVNITRLQVRRGDLADLPQLASAELGWAIDTQQLFIGNGALAEGAPFVGNTEVLTERSNILGGFSEYSFQGNSVGVSIDTQVTRTLEDRLDDYVSVRAWGADGNGVNSGTQINKALADLYGPTGDQQTRIALYIPAGVYLVSAPITLPPNTYIFGDGMGNTIIRCGGSGPAFRTVDSDLEYGVEMGANLDLSLGQSLPKNILLRDLTIQHTQNQNLTDFQSTTDMIFDRVEFVGVFSNLTDTAYSTQTGLSFVSPSGPTASGRIKLSNCKFRNLGIGIKQTQLLNGISLDFCSFDTCYNGILVGDVAVSSTNAPKAVLVQHCHFDRIAREAIIAQRGARFVSMSNFYFDVGNRGSGVAVDPVLTANAPGCVSWMDQFDRPAADIRFESGSDYTDPSTVGTVSRYYADPDDRIVWGLKRNLRTFRYSILGDTNGALTDIQFSPQTGVNGNTVRQEVHYVVKRDTSSRSGVLTLTATDNDVSMNETYDYVGPTNCGIAFSAALVAGVVNINYTINPGSEAVVIVSTEQLVDE